MTLLHSLGPHNCEGREAGPSLPTQREKRAATQWRKSMFLLFEWKGVGEGGGGGGGGREPTKMNYASHEIVESIIIPAALNLHLYNYYQKTTFSKSFPMIYTWTIFYELAGQKSLQHSALYQFPLKIDKQSDTPIHT